LGIDINGTLLVVVHTFEQIDENTCKIRTISARKATKNEIKQYNEGFKMKKEYDFSKGERGKFYYPDAEFFIPIYLEREILEELEKIALKKNLEVNAIVNQFLKKELEIIKYVKG